MVPPNEEAQRQPLPSGSGTVAQKRAGDTTPYGPGGHPTQNTPILMVGRGAALAARITCTLLCSGESGLSCLKIFKWMTLCSYKHSPHLSPGLSNVNCSVISFYLLSSRISESAWSGSYVFSFSWSVNELQDRRNCVVKWRKLWFNFLQRLGLPWQGIDRLHLVGLSKFQQVKPPSFFLR